MAEFEDTLSTLLSNPEAMGQIMSFAKTLGGHSPVEETETAPPNESTQTETAPQNNHTQTETSSGFGQFGDLLSGLSSSLDPGLLGILGQVMQGDHSGGQEDKNMALLAALRPFLKEKRRAKLDQAIQLAKLSRLARLAFQSMKGGEDPV